MTLAESKAEVCTAARVLAAAHLTGIDVGKADLVFWKAVDRYALALYASTPRTLMAPSLRLVQPSQDRMEDLLRELAAEKAKLGDVDAWDVDEGA